MSEDAQLFTIGSDVLRLVVAPSHGFTVTELTPLESGANLLWTLEGSTPRVLGNDLGPPGAQSVKSFDEEVFLGGWFYMCPTAGQPGTLAGRPTWQHGSAPRISWNVVASNACTLACEYVSPDKQFAVRRELTVLADTVIATTIISNRTLGLLTLSAGEHPCLSRQAFAGGRLALLSVSTPREPVAGEWAIPIGADGSASHTLINMERKVIEVTSPSLKGSLRIEPLNETLPYAVLWQHYRSSRLEDADVIAVEPATSSGLGVDDALEADSLVKIPSGAKLTTCLRMTWVAGRPKDFR